MFFFFEDGGGGERGWKLRFEDWEYVCVWRSIVYGSIGWGMPACHV